MKGKTAVIIGGGPAGLTTAYELVKIGVKPVIFERLGRVGGLSATVDYKGNKIDLGGHRFVSKLERVLGWWKSILPPEGDDVDPEHTDKVLLTRRKLSSILYLKKFFEYPISLNPETLSNLGVRRTAEILTSYAKARLRPIKKEKNLEDFLINRFGRELYAHFFRDYSNKLWGVPCTEVKPDWGSQRIRGLSPSGALKDALKKLLYMGTSRFDSFLYPKYGPGQMWGEVSDIVRERGGEVRLNHDVLGIMSRGNKITGVAVRDAMTGETKTVVADYYISSMPLRNLITSWRGRVPPNVLTTARDLPYRELITVGLVTSGLSVKKDSEGLIPDNWVYVQEKGVKLGRIQVYNNWSPYLVKDRENVLLGLEYFCSEGDGLWSMDDSKMTELSIKEAVRIGFIDRRHVLDSVVFRTRKAYPAYWGGYERLDVIRDFTDNYGNLFLVGRNGMHNYCNMDVAMLTAFTVVENIRNGIECKSNIWAVNARHKYEGD